MAIHPATAHNFAEAIRIVHHAAGLTPAWRPGEQREPFALGVTSPRDGDGKTTTAVALANSLADDYSVDVALVDADFHTHSIGEQYGLRGLAGLTEVLRGTARADEVSHSVSSSSLWVVPAGAHAEEGVQGARSEYAARFVENMKEMNQYSIFDLPSALSSSSAPLLARLCDGVIVVARAGRTTRLELEQTLGRLKEANVLGVVLNEWDTKIPDWLDKSLALKP